LPVGSGDDEIWAVENIKPVLFKLQKTKHQYRLFKRLAGMFGGKAPLRLAAQKSRPLAPSVPMRSASA
jgi:hypothetical protein